MVTLMHEVTAALAAIDAARRELDASCHAYAERLEVGAMVEVPAIAIALGPFAQALDFLPIGPNDLIQYTLAIDRGDHDVAGLYDPLHPAVLRLVANTINAGVRVGKPVAVCGEMAGDARLTRLLLGLGLTEFSMHPQQLLDVKREIRRAHSNDRAEEHTSELQSPMRNSYADVCMTQTKAVYQQCHSHVPLPHIHHNTSSIYCILS